MVIILIILKDIMLINKNINLYKSIFLFFVAVQRWTARLLKQFNLIKDINTGSPTLDSR